MKDNHWQGFSTDQVNPLQRAYRWSEFVSDTLSEMVVQPAREVPFKASIRRIGTGSYGFAQFESTAATATSQATSAGRWGSGDSDSLVMTVADNGASTLSQQRWSVDLQTGDIAVRDLSKPWISTSREPISLILLKIPYAKLARFHTTPEDLIGRRLSAADPAVAFASSVIRASKRALLSDPGNDWLDCMNEVIDDVLKLMCRASCGMPRDCEAPEVASIPAHVSCRRAATRFIAHNIHDPSLSVAKVAQAVGVSVRQLQRTFITHGQSPRQYILDERLKLAATMLANGSGAHDGDRIIDIAFDAGFSEASHFSRSFSQRFGCSPREYRKRTN